MWEIIVTVKDSGCRTAFSASQLPLAHAYMKSLTEEYIEFSVTKERV